MDTEVPQRPADDHDLSSDFLHPVSGSLTPHMVIKLLEDAFPDVKLPVQELLKHRILLL